MAVARGRTTIAAVGVAVGVLVASTVAVAALVGGSVDVAAAAVGTGVGRLAAGEAADGGAAFGGTAVAAGAVAGSGVGVGTLGPQELKINAIAIELSTSFFMLSPLKLSAARQGQHLVIYPPF